MAQRALREQEESQLDVISSSNQMIAINEMMANIQRGVSQSTGYFKGLSAVFQQMQNDILKIYSSQSEYKEVSQHFSLIFKSLSASNSAASQGFSHLLENFTEWNKNIDIVKKARKIYEDSLKKYQHYSSKIDKLRLQHNQYKFSVKQETQKEIQKLDRNEKKFASAEQLYQQNNRNVESALYPIYQNRLVAINSVFSGIMQNMKELAEKMDNKLNEVSNPKQVFEQCKLLVLREKQNKRINMVIDDHLEQIEIHEQIKLEKQKSATTPPEIDFQVRRKSIDIAKPGQQSNGSQQPQQQKQQGQVYGMEYAPQSKSTISQNQTATSQYDASNWNQKQQQYSQNNSNQGFQGNANKPVNPPSNPTQKRSQAYVAQLLEEQFGEDSSTKFKNPYGTKSENNTNNDDDNNNNNDNKANDNYARNYYDNNSRNYNSSTNFQNNQDSYQDDNYNNNNYGSSQKYDNNYRSSSNAQSYKNNDNYSRDKKNTANENTNSYNRNNNNNNSNPNPLSQNQSKQNRQQEVQPAYQPPPQPVKPQSQMQTNQVTNSTTNTKSNGISNSVSLGIGLPVFRIGGIGLNLFSSISKSKSQQQQQSQTTQQNQTKDTNQKKANPLVQYLILKQKRGYDQCDDQLIGFPNRH